MLANNIWKIIGELIDKGLAPYKTLRLHTHGWWDSNLVSWIFISIGLIALLYWMNQMFGFKKSGKEDVA